VLIDHKFYNRSTTKFTKQFILNDEVYKVHKFTTKVATERHLEMADSEMEKQEDHLMPPIDSA